MLYLGFTFDSFSKIFHLLLPLITKSLHIKCTKIKRDSKQDTNPILLYTLTLVPFLNTYLSLFFSLPSLFFSLSAMSSPPLCISQINSSLLTPQHRLQSTIQYSDEMVSSPCSSSSSSNTSANEEEEEAKEVMMEVYDGYCTPTSPDRRISPSDNCPPAPKKPRLCRRRVVRLCSYRRRIEFVHELGLVVFKEVRCLQQRKMTTRGRFSIANNYGKEK